MTDRPNILFIFPDQWRGDGLSAVGNPDVDTPNLDELASRGTLFTRAYTPCPSCIAARASLLTGLTPHRAGRLGYRDKVPWQYAQTYPRLLRDAGYQTLCAGKTHFYPQRAHLGFEQIELYDTQKLDADFQSDYHRFLRDRTAGLVVDTAEQMNSNSWHAVPWTHDIALHPSTWTTDRAIDLLRRRDPTRPFLLQVNYHRPHPPLDPPMVWFDRYRERPMRPVPVGDWAGEFARPAVGLQPCVGYLPEHLALLARRAYFAQLAHLDFEIGRLIYFLRTQTSALDNTLIVFSSDHGELLGDHHTWRKFNALEGSARVPLIVTMPSSSSQARGRTNDTPVTLIDLMPTLLEAAGQIAPNPLDGQSLLPALRDEPLPERQYVHGEHAGNHFGGGGWQYLVDRQHKYAWQTTSGRELLFDLIHDPDERHDLTPDPDARPALETMRRRLIEILQNRSDQALTDGICLIPGTQLPATRPWASTGLTPAHASPRSS